MYIKILYLKKHRTHYNYLFINVKLRKNEYLCHMAHLAGDGSFREKLSKSFVNSGIINSYIRYLIGLILKMFDSGIQKYSKKMLFFYFVTRPL